MNTQSTQNRYPRAGDVAILCEGDVSGFEVDLIEKYIAARAPDVLADVWACGTQDSIFGMADAIGRSRPLVVVEDRDYRTTEQAAADCKRKQKDRLDRGSKIQHWHPWFRNEIENYLIEPEVLVPAMADYFGIDDHGRIHDRLDSVIACLRVDQAALFALYQFRYSIPSKPRYIFEGLPKRTARPCWIAEKRGMVAPKIEVVKDALEEVLKSKAKLLQRDCEAIDCNKYMEQFDSKCHEWSGVTASSCYWRIEWAGKDILICLSRWLAAEFGICIPPNRDRTQVDWDALAGERNADGSLARKDQEIERLISHELQPRLVNSFLKYLPSACMEVQQEWNLLLDQVKHIAVE